MFAELYLLLYNKKHLMSMVFILITHCVRQAEDIQKDKSVNIFAGQNLLGLRGRQESSLPWDNGIQKGMQKKYIPYILSSGHHHVARLSSTVVECWCSSLWLAQFQNSGKAKKLCAVPEVCGRSRRSGSRGVSMCVSSWISCSSSCVCGTLWEKLE